MAHRPTTVLFVCTGNAGRSQMAEALLRREVGDRAEVLSAGVQPWKALHPESAPLMAARGIDISGQAPKHVRTMVDRALDLVVTIGAEALRETPALRGCPRRMHWAIDDPAEAGDVPAAFRHSLAEIERRMPDVVRVIGDLTQPSELRHAPGISTCFGRPGPFRPAEHLPMAAEAGFRCIELNCYLGSEDFAYDRPGAIDELLGALDATGLAVYSVHAPGGLLDLPGRGIMAGRAAFDMARFFVDLTAALGAQVLVVHGMAGDDALLLEGLRELQEHVLPLPCAIGWENAWAGHSAQEHLAALGELNPGAFGFVLDTGHSHIGGDTDAYLPACGARLCGLHLNDNDGARDQHVLPGQGTGEWDGLMQKLETAGYEGPLMLEVQPPGYEDDLPRLLREAAESVEFVRGGGSK